MTLELELPDDVKSLADLYRIDFVPRTINRAFQVLLNTRHLYQSIELPAEKFKQFCQRFGEPTATLAFGSLRGNWIPKWIPISQFGDKPAQYPRETTAFDLPTIEAFCDDCKKPQPFNPQGAQIASPYVDLREDGQVFALSYRCQGCKGFVLTFLVTRKLFRLTLSGRSTIEQVQVPAYIPKVMQRYYTAAVIAYNCNQVLPALFMLRTLIEQHMRTALTPAKFQDAVELCEAYQKSLDDEFKKRFPSLPDIYSKLSEALHAAREDAELFQSEKERTEKHFRAKKSWDEDR